MRKSFLGVSDQVRHKPGCLASEDFNRKEEGLFYTCSVTKVADRNSASDLRLSFRICKGRFSCDTAHLFDMSVMSYWCTNKIKLKMFVFCSLLSFVCFKHVLAYMMT